MRRLGPASWGIRYAGGHRWWVYAHHASEMLFVGGRFHADRLRRAVTEPSTKQRRIAPGIFYSWNALDGGLRQPAHRLRGGDGRREGCVALIPVNERDAFAIWQPQGEAPRRHGSPPDVPAYFSDPRLNFTHTNYPLLVPMMSAAADVLTGDERLCKLPSLLLFVGLGAVVYSTIRRFSGHRSAITATALLLNLPMFYNDAGSGTAEMALTAFYGCAVVCIVRWQKRRLWSDLVMAFLFAGCCALAKNEGLLVCAICGLVIAGHSWPFNRRAFLQMTTFLAILAIVIGPWLIYRRGIPVVNADFEKD